jgi:hypothetical protein
VTTMLRMTFSCSPAHIDPNGGGEP